VSLSASSRTPPPWIPGVFSALLALVLYAVNLWGVSNIYDDQFIVESDQRVSHPHLWKEFWTRDYFRGGMDNLYRPLVSQSFGLQWWLHGDRSWAFHLVNILLHAAVAAAVAELGRRLGGFSVGLIAGLLFASHPVHVEAVAALVGRSESACALGVVGAMVLFLHYPMTRARALAIWAVSVAAMLSKEPGILLPLLLWVLWIFRKRNASAGERNAMQLLAVLMIWSVIALFILREYVLSLKFEWDRSFLDFTIQPLIRARGLDRWLIPIALVGRYVRLLIFPSALSIDYGEAVIRTTISHADFYLWLGFAAILVWIIWVIICLLRGYRAALVCLLAMAITYSMASNIIIIATIFGERLIYLPSAFFLILGIARLPKTIGLPLVMILLVLACGRTFTYARQWNDRDSFYEYSLANQPRSVRLMLLTGEVARQEHRPDEARAIAAEGRAIEPDYYDFWLDSGLIEQDSGNWPLAARFYKRAFELHPTQSVAKLMTHAQQMARGASTQSSTKP
jgi:protein O-mannosyl-transferase